MNHQQTLPLLPLLHHDEVLFFRAGDDVALGRALVAVATEPDAAAARARAARRRYEEYAWDRNAERYVAVLRPGEDIA